MSGSPRRLGGITLLVGLDAAAPGCPPSTAPIRSAVKDEEWLTERVKHHAQIPSPIFPAS